MTLPYKLKNNKYKYLENFKILLEARKNVHRTRRNRLKYLDGKIEKQYFMGCNGIFYHREN